MHILLNCAIICASSPQIFHRSIDFQPLVAAWDNECLIFLYWEYKVKGTFYIFKYQHIYFYYYHSIYNMDIIIPVLSLVQHFFRSMSTQCVPKEDKEKQKRSSFPDKKDVYFEVSLQYKLIVKGFRS